MTAELAEQLRIPASGVVITSVRSGSGAEKAGLQPGMLISRVGDIDVENVDDLERAAEAVGDADRVLVLVRFTNGESVVPRFVLIELNHDKG